MARLLGKRKILYWLIPQHPLSDTEAPCTTTLSLDPLPLGDGLVDTPPQKYRDAETLAVCSLVNLSQASFTFHPDTTFPLSEYLLFWSLRQERGEISDEERSQKGTGAPAERLPGP